MNEIMLHNKVKMDNNAIVRLYGITQDPKTKNYIMVLEYAEDGNSNPLNRPTAEDIYNILLRWQYEPNDKQTIELQAQIKEADEINNNSSNSGITSNNLGISYNTHSEAIYTSRLLDFNNLPEPKNSDDYYEQNDNIISEKFSESLQIDISQLDINMVND
ncbi:uncharacterized protein OCT59_012481 [Rhizophagus irregularis]|uniref:uncharacterized protein n=1 Tax=Rhizophagus irregularis TaxID=588596 RepID=UPI0033189A2E|nr:hypothetical protein OCT59_012481 [Rhizophagus irregularis]